MVDNRNAITTVNPKSLLEISGKIVDVNIHFVENLATLIGEIPLTLIQYLISNYCKFLDERTNNLKSFLNRSPHPFLFSLHPHKIYTLSFTCVLYHQILRYEKIDTEYVYRFCEFCYDNYVEFQVPIKYLDTIELIRKKNITLPGQCFINCAVDFTCLKCRILLLEPDDINHDDS